MTARRTTPPMASDRGDVLARARSALGALTSGATTRWGGPRGPSRRPSLSDTLRDVERLACESADAFGPASRGSAPVPTHIAVLDGGLAAAEHRLTTFADREREVDRQRTLDEVAALVVALRAAVAVAGRLGLDDAPATSIVDASAELVDLRAHDLKTALGTVRLAGT